MKILSLFSNIGVAEAYLEEIGFDVVLANEIESKRVEVYRHIYPRTEVVCGDITDENIEDEIITKAKKLKVDIVMATPPCQGMSTAGKQDKSDVRNQLIYNAVNIVKSIMPKYIMLENVPLQIKTKINYNGNQVVIPEYLDSELGEKYIINNYIVNTADYGVPQSRERAIFLMTRKDIENIWILPEKEHEKKTLLDAIGKLPQLDPLVYDIPYEEHLKIFPKYEENKLKAEKISKWHVPPQHVKRQVDVMLRTPSGSTAFDNCEKYLPRKKNGEIVQGYKNTYKRQNWDIPAFTITMYNRTISSQNNVHPGRFMGYDEEGLALYSDPRVLTLYELMLCMSLPSDWRLPNDMSESFIRSVIGEGIPPLFIKKLFKQLL